MCQLLDRDISEVGLGQRERRNWEDVFAAHVQRFSAGHQLLQLRALPKQLCHRGRRRGDLLEVVEEQQHLPRPYLRLEIVEERPITHFPQADGSGGDRQDGFDVAACCEVDEVDPVLEVVTQVSGHLQRQPGLAGAAGAQQREQAHAAEPVSDLLEFVRAPDETVESGREVAGNRAERLFCWRLEALAEQHHQVVFDQFAQLLS